MENKKEKVNPFLILFVGMIIGAVSYGTLISANQKSFSSNISDSTTSKIEKDVLPPKGVELPVVWRDMGVQLVESGAIDEERFKALYESRGQFTNEYKNLLSGKNNGKIIITKENSSYVLNLFWALGLANKNQILEQGEMSDPAYGGAKNFASTGGWSLAKGNPMDHYSMHQFIVLTDVEQALVDKVSRGIYRPCCGNSVHFPDCNHGMAMLGFLELMASQGVNEQDMWKAALTLNSYWFPDTYITIATYMQEKGIEWKDVSPKEMLGATYSSARGFANIASQVKQPAGQQQSGSGCGVDSGQPAAPRQQSGCGI